MVRADLSSPFSHLGNLRALRRISETDGLSPSICRHPTGRFCVLMPMRVQIPAAEDGFWYLDGRTNRTFTRGEAVTVKFSD